RLLVDLSSVLRRPSATVMDAVITPDGSALTLVVMGTLSGPARVTSLSVVQIPVSGQRQLHFIYRLPQGDSFSFFSADPTGKHFLLGTGTPPNGPLDGRIHNGRLIPLGPNPTIVLAM